jgi:transposase
MSRFIGLDVHKRETQVCILSPTGEKLLALRIPTTREALTTFARSHLQATDSLALEATTNTWAIVQLLRPFVQKIVVSNPLQTRAIAAAKVKTDKIDASVLAHLLRLGYLPEVWQPDVATQEARALCHRRAALVADRTAIKNRLHALLAMRLIVPTEKDLFGKKGLAWLQKVALDPLGRTALESDLRLLAALQTEITALDLQIATRAQPNDSVRLLMSLPGVDMAVALGLFSAWGPITRFASAAQAASYLGLAPRTKQSGDHCYHGPITKQGNSHVRWLIIQAAQHLDKHPGPLGVFFRRLCHKKNRNVAVVAAARKLALIGWHMLQKNQPYRYALPAATAAKLARLRIRAGGERRKGGNPKGQKAVAKLGAGLRSRTVPGLGRVYEREGLPALSTPPAGETRLLLTLKLQETMQNLHQEQILAKAKPAAQPQPMEVA